MKDLMQKKTVNKKSTLKTNKKKRMKTILSPNDLPADFGLPHQSDPVGMWMNNIHLRLWRLEKFLGMDDAGAQKKNKTMIKRVCAVKK